METIISTLGPLHGLFVLITALLILYTDHKGFQYFTGKITTISPRFIHRSHQLVWIGLTVIILSGATLAARAWSYYLDNPVFILKMGFVAILVMNAFAIGTIAKKATTTAFTDLTKEEKWTLLTSGGLSVIGWLGAIVIGLLLL